MEQTQYNLFERAKIEVEFAEIYKNVGLGTTIWSPLASGLLSGKYNDGIPKGSRLAMDDLGWLKETLVMEDKIKKVKKLSEFAAKLGVTTAAVSIAWCIKNPHVSTAILGATKKQQLLDNLKALEVVEKLTPDVIEKIETIMKTKPAKPDF
jgi:aryl-alcohol dehydrogenase-like predicted oxidoreductase